MGLMLPRSRRGVPPGSYTGEFWFLEAAHSPWPVVVSLHALRLLSRVLSCLPLLRTLVMETAHPGHPGRSPCS